MYYTFLHLCKYVLQVRDGYKIEASQGEFNKWIVVSPKVFISLTSLHEDFV
jgi:hypothetical protein